METAFSHLVRRVFAAGLAPGVVDRRWPAFTRAFKDFDAKASAAFSDEDVERLVGDAEIVRNRRKIVATLANARVLVDLGGEAGLREWLAGQEDPAAALRERFAGLGPASAEQLASTLREPEVCATAAAG